jgi:hypothetical protein
MKALPSWSAGLLGLALIAACSEDEPSRPGEARLEGEVDGMKLLAGGAVLWPLGDGWTGGRVLVTESTDPCAALKADRRPRGSFVLDIQLFDDSGQSKATAASAGAYVTPAPASGGAPRSAQVALLRMDAACNIVATKRGMPGTKITLDREMTFTEPLAARLEILLEGSAPLQGTFSAAHCEAQPSKTLLDPRREGSCGP